MMSASGSTPLRIFKTTTPIREYHGRYCIVHYRTCKDRFLKPLSEKAFNSIQASRITRMQSCNPLHQLADICSKVPAVYDSDKHGIHTRCYKSFTNTTHVTAALRKCTESPSVADKSPHKHRKRSSSAAADTLFPQNKCLFCEKGPTCKRGKFITLSRCETLDGAQKIFDTATEKADFTLLGKITGIDLVAREARFHEHCRKQYIRREDRQHHMSSTLHSAEDDDDCVDGCAEQRRAYDAAFKHVCHYITQHIVQDGCVLRMTTVREEYLNYMQEHSPEFYNPHHKTQKLKDKIVRHFGSAIQFWQPNVKSELLYSSDVSAGAAIELAFESATSEDKLLQDAAMTLRRNILHAHTTAAEMPWPPSADYLSAGVVLPPTALTDFLSRVITGKPVTAASQRASWIVSSLSEDICAATTNGKWKQPKHLLMGMTLRHLTGSAQVITLINRFGHCSSYSHLLELENAMAIQSLSRDSVLPSNISVDGNKFCHCCFDNFDLLEETASGAGTTHTTHGIVIQELKADFSSSSASETSMPRTKEKVKPIIDELPVFFCPKRVEPPMSFPAMTGTQMLDCSSVSVYTAAEQVWTVCRSQYNQNFTVPEWAGWISTTSSVLAPVQQSVVGYLPPVLFPITDYSTVHQCILIAMEAAGTLRQKYCFITMDLAAAKIALDITWHTPDKFHNVIIQLGGFHIMCSYLGALGKMMCGSGFEDLVMQAGVCAGGSIDKVMAGKHYNRAMRVHQLMLDATERLLLEAFMEQNDSSLHFPAELESVATAPSADQQQAVLDCSEFQLFVAQFNKFRHDVRDGKHGSTAKFWVIYMECVWHLLRFQRSIKENNFDLYLSSIYNLCSLLFAADHHNYARYLSLQYMQLKNLSATHPGAEELLRDNGFSVARSAVPACRNAVDITIEQTINRSAKTSGGIIGFSRNASAYQRWCITRHARTAYAQATMDRVDLDTVSSDVHNSLQRSKLKGSETAVSKLLEAFRQFTNPFNITSSNRDALYCLSSGQPASDKVASDLLEYVDAGHVAAEQFITSRLCNKTVKFHDTLKRQNLTTFKSMAVCKQLSTSQKKTVEIKAERNLLGRLLFLSRENDISLPKLFEYPLGPIPWALATADGGMIKTSKAQLLHYLESLVQPCQITPSSLKDAINILDGNALLQACSHVPDTFEELATQMFGCLPKSPIVHFVTDSYKDMSIKQSERTRRGFSPAFCVGGSKTKLPRDFKAFMRNSENKRQLIRLLLSEWRSSCKYATRLHGRTLYFVEEEDCWVLTSDGNDVTGMIATDLCSDHEEADSRIILHCLHASRTASATTAIVVRSPDTDVLVILLAYASSLCQRVYLDTGTGNKRRLIDIQAIADVLGTDVCAALPAYHAFTGCDYTSSFVRKGKVQPFKIVCRHSDFTAAFKNLGTSADMDGTQLPALEQFVCSMYGRAAYKDTNALRYRLFQARYEVKSVDTAFTIPDGLDLCLLPPCRAVLELHARRANYVAHMWRNAHVCYQRLPSPIGHGWMQADDKHITVQWTKGDLLPQQLVDVLSTCPSRATEQYEEVEEDCEVDNILDMMFEDDDEDNSE